MIIEFSKEYYLNTDEKNILKTEILYDPSTKKIVNFTIIQFYIDDTRKKHIIVLHDFSHGCYNVHRYYLGHAMREEKRNTLLSMGLVHQIKKEVKATWKENRNHYLMRCLPHELREEH